MNEVNRRYFLMSSGLAAAAPLAARASSLNGANNRVRVAVIGVKGRGGEHIRGAAFCDDCQEAQHFVVAHEAECLANKIFGDLSSAKREHLVGE